jgi:hypothetical protein
LAQQKHIPVQPARLCFYPVRETAYIDDDTFIVSLWKLMNARHFTAYVSFGEVCFIDDLNKDMPRLEQWVHSKQREKLLQLGYPIPPSGYPLSPSGYPSSPT